MSEQEERKHGFDILALHAGHNYNFIDTIG